MFNLQGAQSSGVCALAYLPRSGLLLTAGACGQVRLWACARAWRTGRLATPTLLATVKEHRQRVTGLEVTGDEAEFLSCSKDGSCIIWELGG